MKRLLLILCFGGLITSTVIAKSDKKHIIIKNGNDADFGKTALKVILPPLAGLSFLNYAINPQVKLSPAFLFRGLNGFICGIFNKGMVNNEALLRTEAGVTGALLVGAAIVKVIEGTDTYVVRPTVKAAKDTYAGFKTCVDFVKNNKVISTLGALGAAAVIYQLQ